MEGGGVVGKVYFLRSALGKGTNFDFSKRHEYNNLYYTILLFCLSMFHHKISKSREPIISHDINVFFFPNSSLHATGHVV